MRYNTTHLLQFFFSCRELGLVVLTHYSQRHTDTVGIQFLFLVHFVHTIQISECSMLILRKLWFLSQPEGKTKSRAQLQQLLFSDCVELNRGLFYHFLSKLFILESCLTDMTDRNGKVP